MAVNQKRLVEEFEKLVSIDSLSFQERKMADYLKERWQELGVTLAEDDAAARIGGNTGNLFGVLPAERLCAERTAKQEPVLLVAHMDTVAPGIGKRAIVHEDGTITSDGTTVLGADDAAAIAVILEAVRELQEEKCPHREIQLLFPAAEEAYTVGASAFDFAAVTAKLAYCLDCSDVIGSYSAQEPTLISFRIRVHGRGAHAGFEPQNGINAVAAAAAAIARIQQGWTDDHTTLNFGRIDGGTATNAVPDLVTVEGEIRSAVHEDALALYDRVMAVFAEEADRIGASAEGDRVIRLRAYRIADDDPALVLYKDVLRRRGIAPYAKPSFGGSDNNVLVRNGIHGLCMYNAMHQCHTTKEYTTVGELTELTEIVKDLCRA